METTYCNVLYYDLDYSIYYKACIEGIRYWILCGPPTITTLMLCLDSRLIYCYSNLNLLKKHVLDSGGSLTQPIITSDCCKRSIFNYNNIANIFTYYMIGGMRGGIEYIESVGITITQEDRS